MAWAHYSFPWSVLSRKVHRAPTINNPPSSHRLICSLILVPWCHRSLSQMTGFQKPRRKLRKNTFVWQKSFPGCSLAPHGYLPYLARPSFSTSAVIKPSGGFKSIPKPMLHPRPLNQDPRSRTQVSVFFQFPKWFPCAARLKATGPRPHGRDENFYHLHPGVLTSLRKVLSVMTSPCGLTHPSLCCDVIHLWGRSRVPLSRTRAARVG